MTFLAKVHLILRRAVLTLVLAFVVVCFVASYNEEFGGILFVPTWAALFLVWPYLDRKLNFKFPRIFRSRPRRSTAWGRVIVAGMIAFVITFGIALLPVGDFSAVAGPVIWIALYYGWPALSRILPLPKAWKVKAQTGGASPVPKRSVWRLLGNGALALTSVIMVMTLLPAMVVMAPIGHSMERARNVHDSIHVGMTVPELLNASRDCDVFGASSEFPYDKSPDDIPAMNLSRNREGEYRVYDVAANRNLALTETQAVERLHEKLHDGYRWRFNYTYLNITPMHISFSVIVGSDGRVAEVTPVHGWD